VNLSGRLYRSLGPAPTAAAISRSGAVPDGEVQLHGEPLELAGVVKRFGGLVALNDISLEARPGAITGLIGANGSGKTTALNLVTGFYRADTGTIRVGSREVTGLRPYRIARLGVVRTFQTPLIPDKLTTVEVVASSRYVRDYVGLLAAVLRLPSFRRARERDLAEAHRVLRMLGLEGLADRQAASLPLGSRRLVEVARAIAANPAVLLLDEPASGLDEHEIQRLAEVIGRVRQAGATVLLIEHNFAMVCGVADFIYALDFGRLIAAGPPRDIQANEAVIRSYLGTPGAGVAPTSARRVEGAGAVHKAAG
jgi:branched-chain amino acid transport system permease protein